MRSNLKRFAVLLAIASLFAVAFASCADYMDGGGGGGGGDDPPIGYKYINDTTTIVKPDSI